jgi:phospholipid-binding lipoprotein MlaA
MNTRIARSLVVSALALALLGLGQDGRAQETGTPSSWGPGLDLENSGPRSAAAQESQRQSDPWERFNRPMHRFNMTLDRIALRPVAKTYQTVTPAPLRNGVRKFFSNLQQPLASLNLLLQGEPGPAGAALGRFAINATVGIGGFFDPASRMEIPYRDADFGQTLGRWGWRDSRYLVMPIFGPGTVRDVGGRLATTRVSPISWAAREYGWGVSVMYGIDARANALQFDDLLREAEDDYLLVRDAYLQRRRCQIEDCSSDLPDYLLPDYDYEIPDVDLGEIRR